MLDERLRDFNSLSADEDEACKTVYAYFGLAMYHVQCLEHAIVSAITAITFSTKDVQASDTTEAQYALFDSYVSKQFDLTLGGLVKAIKALNFIEFSQAFMEKLSYAKDIRNRLAHDFFREHAESWLSYTGKQAMLRELIEASDLFIVLDDAIGKIIVPYAEKIGTNEEVGRKK